MSSNPANPIEKFNTTFILLHCSDHSLDCFMITDIVLLQLTCMLEVDQQSYIIAIPYILWLYFSTVTSNLKMSLAT